jgi:hypothetical protein
MKIERKEGEDSFPHPLRMIIINYYSIPNPTPPNVHYQPDFFLFILLPSFPSLLLACLSF